MLSTTLHVVQTCVIYVHHLRYESFQERKKKKTCISSADNLCFNVIKRNLIFKVWLVNEYTRHREFVPLKIVRITWRAYHTFSVRKKYRYVIRTVSCITGILDGYDGFCIIKAFSLRTVFYPHRVFNSIHVCFKAES